MEQLRSSIFDVTVHAFDTSSVVRLRSSPNFTPDRIIVLPFTVTLTTLTFNQRSSRRFGNNFWKSSPEGHNLHLSYSYEKKNSFSWHTVACYAPVLVPCSRQKSVRYKFRIRDRAKYSFVFNGRPKKRVYQRSSPLLIPTSIRTIKLNLSFGEIKPSMNPATIRKGTAASITFPALRVICWKA